MRAVLSLVLCLGFALASPVLAAECELVGKNACARGDAACECPAIAPVVDPNDVFDQCMSFCCPEGTGCTPTSTQAQICNCSCSGGIPHEFGELILCR